MPTVSHLPEHKISGTNVAQSPFLLLVYQFFDTINVSTEKRSNTEGHRIAIDEAPQSEGVICGLLNSTGGSSFINGHGWFTWLDVAAAKME